MKKTRRTASSQRPAAGAPSVRSATARTTLIGCALIVLSSFAVYAGAFTGPFVYDDRGSIVDNRTIERLWALDVLTAPHETPTAGRPLVNVSFALNYALDGRHVRGYHAGNILIHALCGLALFGIARRTMQQDGASLAIALLWTVHPLASEPVNYITQRTESLMALFYLLTLYCAVRAWRSPADRARWESLAVAACLLGMASKESMVTAPLAVILFDRVFIYESWSAAFRQRRRLYAGLALSWVFLAFLVASSPRNLSAGFGSHDAAPWTYLLNQAVMIAQYLKLSVWPRALVLYYGWPEPLTLSGVLPQALLVMALLSTTIIALVRWPRVGFLGAWFFVTLAPTSSILPIATEVGAERRMYIALMAVVALLVFAFRAVVVDSRLRVTAAAIATLLLGAQTLVRTTEYQSSLRLAETTAERWPSPGAHSMLGTELAAAGRFGEAEAHLRQAADVHPPAQYYLATVLAETGRGGEAIERFETYIRSQPPELDQVQQARGLLGDALLKEGRLDEAAVQFKSIADRSGDRQALIQLAQIHMRQRRFGEAIPLLRQALQSNEDARTLGSLGVALASTGQMDDAVVAFQRAVQLDPNNTSARANLARALALLRR